MTNSYHNNNSNYGSIDEDESEWSGPKVDHDDSTHLIESGRNYNNNGTFTRSIRDEEMRRSSRRSSSRIQTRVVSIIESSFRLTSGNHCSIRDAGGSATIPNTVINMTKNLVGAGVLSLSGGIAIFSARPIAVIPAAIAIIVMGTIFGYMSVIIGKVCKMTMSASFKECWEETIGSGSYWVAIVNTLKPACGNLAYATILSQTLQLLLQGFFNMYWNRITCLLVITIIGLLPLCLMKDLHALAPFSMVGLSSVILVLICMIIRLLDGTYKENGTYYNDIEYKPDFIPRQGDFRLTKLLPFVCMVYEAYVMHYNSPRFYVELKQSTIPRYSYAVGYSFGLASILYTLIAMTGFLTFGYNSNSFILNNYSPNDPLAMLCRICIGISTLLTYPIVFIGVRDNLLDLLDFPIHLQTSDNMNLFSIILLSVLTILSIFITDLGMINAVGGGTLATILCFIFPALMLRQAVKDLGGAATNAQKFEVEFVMILMIIGVVFGIVGVIEALV